MYTKLTIVALLACFASSFALSKGLGEQIECLHQTRVAQGRIYENKIREAVEKIRQVLRTGINGGPPLDPLDVVDRQLTFNNDVFNFDSNWTAKSEGLSNFDLSQISLSLIGLNLKFQVDWPLVTASGDYSIDGSTSLVEQKLLGKGTFDVALNGFTIKGKGKIGTKSVNGKLVVQIKSLSVEVSLKKFALALTGFMNDEELSKQISDNLSNNLPQIIADNNAKINEAIEKALPYINGLLAGNGGSYGVSPVRC